MTTTSPPPNPRLQRTPSASPPSPLSRQPLGRGTSWVALVLLAVCSVFCAQSLDIPASSLPPELAVPAAATGVTAHRAGKLAAVEYHLSTPYPAERFLAGTTAQLEHRGWKAAERDLLNPTIPTSNVRGWTSYVDARVSPHVGVHQWLGDWRNAEGDVVSYALQYSSVADDRASEQPPPSSSDLHVTAFLVPADQAKAMAAQAKRQRGK